MSITIHNKCKITYGPTLTYSPTELTAAYGVSAVAACTSGSYINIYYNVPVLVFGTLIYNEFSCKTIVADGYYEDGGLTLYVVDGEFVSVAVCP